MKRRPGRGLLLVACGLALLTGALPRPAFATWSIVAVDPETREVGGAAATCTVGVEIIHAVAPGKGLIFAQAATHRGARDHGVAMIAEGAGAQEVIDAIANEEFNPGRLWNAPWREQQYGVAVLGADAPAVAHFTGSDTVAWSGARAAAHVSVQGNMLHGPEVVDASLRAFRAADSAGTCRPSLAERLLRALEAGAAQGGDVRCAKERGALTAFLTVSAPDDAADSPSLYLVVPRAFGLLGAIRHMVVPYSLPEEPAVAQLRALYERWRARDPDGRPPCPANGLRSGPGAATESRAGAAPRPAAE